MLKHLFKLIWNKRKQNFLFLSEILVSFLVIFAVFSFITFYYQNYTKPLGFEYKHVWAINYDNEHVTKNADSLQIFYRNLKNSLKAMPQIEAVTFSGTNFPYSNSNISTSLNKNGKRFNWVNVYADAEDYVKVWNVKLIAGRWFNEDDKATKNKSIIINETLQTAIFGKRSAVGQLLGDFEDKNSMKVIGVVQDIKANGDYWPAGNAMFNRADTSDLRQNRNILVKVSENANAAFESELYKFMTSTFKNSTVGIEHLTEMRDAKNEVTIIPMIIFIIIASFLIINVALGLFGVLWYNINKRRGEIGLRRAIGATGTNVSYQLVVEALLLATLSLVVGCFFAVQFPLLNVFDVASSVYLIAMVLTVIFIYLLVFLCALYPGKQAAAIHPAVALHEE
ncbi:ABC transporter permease [Pedobacter sp. Du54]|uniref:ABC transporter permease n=1 Tax=Pedobacter anseongensis TaxID=3133439 RepID=UPI0030ACED94